MYVGVDLLCMLELKLNMYVDVTLLLCMSIPCWLDVEVHSMMVVCM